MIVGMLGPDDVWWINGLANEYRDALAPGYVNLDLAPFFVRPGNVAVGHEEAGVMLFGCQDLANYSGHIMCVPWVRGRNAVEFAKACIAWLFTNCDVACISFDIPKENRPARVVCRAVGGTPVADSVDTIGRRCVLYKLERKRWAQSSAV